MKKKIYSKLWLYFVAIVAAIMLGTVFIMVPLIFLFIHWGFFAHNQDVPFIPILFLLCISILIGTVISLFVAKKILKPISVFSEVSNEVARGNFEIRMEPMSRIKEIQELTHNFNIMVTELSSIETLRIDFVANVSHEFKTPLAAIEGYATLLQEKELSDSDKDEYIHMIMDSAKKLSVLTGNILSLSKLENQELVLDNLEFRLDEQIREIILLLENKWSEKNIDLIIELEKVKFSGSKSLLGQVWMNLFDNAIKFSPNGGQIQILLTIWNGGVMVKVKDNGSGIDSTEINHVFDKFYQSERSRNETGNGLGLSLVKRIIDICNGTITVNSSMNMGSEFIVFLPVNKRN